MPRARKRLGRASIAFCVHSEAVAARDEQGWDAEMGPPVGRERSTGTVLADQPHVVGERVRQRLQLRPRRLQPHSLRSRTCTHGRPWRRSPPAGPRPRARCARGQNLSQARVRPVQSAVIERTVHEHDGRAGARTRAGDPRSIRRADRADGRSLRVGGGRRHHCPGRSRSGPHAPARARVTGRERKPSARGAHRDQKDRTAGDDRGITRMQAVPWPPKTATRSRIPISPWPPRKPLLVPGPSSITSISSASSR